MPWSPPRRLQLQALALSGTNLYAGVYFSRAGDRVSAFPAKANIGTTGGRFGSLAYSPATGFSCILSDATVGQPYRIQTSPSLVEGSWTDFTNFTYTGPIVINDPSAVGATDKFYRAVTP